MEKTFLSIQTKDCFGMGDQVKFNFLCFFCLVLGFTEDKKKLLCVMFCSAEGK